MELVLVAEDALSMAVMRRLLADCGRGIQVHTAIISGGVDAIRKRVPVYRNACRVLPHVLLIDLDQTPCAPDLLESWGLTHKMPTLLIRVAVRTVEAWLLADALGLAEQLKVSPTKIPSRPETLENPKQTLVNLARHSRSRRIASELAPSPGSRAQVGPLYNTRLCEFVAQRWSPQKASKGAPSLAKTILRLDEFVS